MAELLSILYFSLFVVTGYFVVCCILPRTENPLIRLWLGGVCGLFLLLWLPALFSFLFGFTLLAQYCALVVCLGIGFCCFLFWKKRALCSLKGSWAGYRYAFAALIPLFLLGCVLFLTHIIPERDGILYAGQSTFGDLPLHLGLVTSLSVQGTFPPDYSIYPGTAVGYPFLCDSVSATFHVLGANLRFCMLLPAIFAYGLVLLGAYCFFQRWLRRSNVSVLATLLFFLGGGFGFVYFFDRLQAYPGNLLRIFQAFYQTPTNYTDYGLLWVNPIADMLIPQRATLFGWALLFPALYLLRRAAFEEEYKLFVPLGVLAGGMPLVHTHSFFALGVISFVFLCRAVIRWDNKKVLLGWVLYGITALALAAPQLICFTFQQAGGFLELQFNWANTTDTFLWFYIKNWGLLFLLLPIAFYRLSGREKAFYGGALVLWVLVELIQFQPNPYDNNKLLFVCFAFTCGIVANLLCDLYQRLKEWKGRQMLAAMVLITLFLSGTLTLGRELVSEYQLFDQDEIEAAAFIQEHSEPDALFLTANNHNNLVSSLTGRNILCGTSSYLYFHGIGFETREQRVTLAYQQPEMYFSTLQEEYGIDYVLFGDNEFYQYQSGDSYFQTHYPLVFENASIRIYQVGQ